MQTQHRRAYWLLLGIFLPTLAFGQSGSAGAAPDGSPAVVWCLDRERDVVSRDLPSACHGTIVSEAEARAVQARRESKIAHALAPPRPSESLQGLRLASLGTAFFVDPTGDLITNSHVVVGCKAMQVRSPGRSPIGASVLAVDQVQDLALLHVTARPPGYAIFRSGAGAGFIRNVSAVGYPDEGLPTLEPQAVQGKLLRADDGAGHMLISMDVRHGNSGSPILDTGGLVVGVIRAKIDSSAVYARTGHEVADTGIGVPVANVLDFLTRNRLRFYSASGAPAREPGRLLSEARGFIARAECWK